ncbi:hypothetical protein MiSe_36990 [Microseira wollei NIES-4236]|uniref:Uncharacterized protein n=1 Tax=Microseira wollei NIES-4236 TaxID=2530354 RepID=A0AAV3XES1_9CYAN|nr:hypothetical protein MiSe_36990 [Microseira wollei NIES-4236]
MRVRQRGESLKTTNNINRLLQKLPQRRDPMPTPQELLQRYNTQLMVPYSRLTHPTNYCIILFADSRDSLLKNLHRFS